MNKLIIGLGILVIAVFGWLAFKENTIYYVATIDNEVTELEEEIINIKTEAQAGTLSPEAATAAKLSITTRLDKINLTIAESNKTKLASAQQKVLLDSLDRLKYILSRYWDLLIIVEHTATSGKRITPAFAETIEIVEGNVVDVVEDYTPEDYYSPTEIEE